MSYMLQHIRHYLLGAPGRRDRINDSLCLLKTQIYATLASGTVKESLTLPEKTTTMAHYLLLLLGIIAAGGGGELFVRGAVGITHWARIPGGSLGQQWLRLPLPVPNVPPP